MPEPLPPGRRSILTPRRRDDDTGTSGAGPAHEVRGPTEEEDEDDVDGVRAAARAATTLAVFEHPTTLVAARGRCSRSASVGDRQQDAKRAHTRRKAVAHALREPGRIGVGGIGDLRIGYKPAPDTLAGALLGVIDATTPNEQAAAVDALVHHRAVVSAGSAGRAAREARARLHQALARLPGAPDGDTVRTEIKTEIEPLILRWAVRLAWDDAEVQLAARGRDRGWFVSFAQGFRMQARKHVAALLNVIADDPEPFARVVRHSLRRLDRELALALLLDGEQWRRKVAVMLRCTPKVLRTRRWRLKRRLKPGKHVTPRGGVPTRKPRP